MMHRALRGLGVPILVGADRAESGRRAVRDHSPSVILLDDGFQHRRLARDADIVLVSALDPFGGGLLPLGRLREPARGLSRASLIVLTHCEGLSQERLSGAEAALRSLAPGVPIARAEHRPEAVFDLKREERLGLSRLKGQRAASLCALGDPAPFEGDLRRLGAEISQAWRYPDHHPFTLEELRAVEDLRAGATVVTTLKDFPRLPAGWRDVLSGDVLALEVRLELRTGREFWEAALFHGKP
jgi:tetraacyldisaccharide 4'-kinase